MASKVMVKMPVQPFVGNTQVTKSSSKPNANDVLAIGRSTEIRSPEGSGASTPPTAATKANGVTTASSMSAGGNGSDGRVAQLEQNIKYLQEQHQLMLTGLHHEIDCLRHRNRELQFQLVFAKGTNVSTPSSPEDEKQKLYSNSPKVLNITPLQVEILEKELGEMKVQLQESECRNVYLSAIVDEQKKKLERYERDRERERERGIQPDPELLRKLDDAESLIRRLRRENSDLRRENAAAAAAATSGVAYQQVRDYHHTQRSGAGGGGGGGGQRRRGGNHGNASTNGGAHATNGSAAPNLAASAGPNAGASGAPTAGGNQQQHFRPNWFPPLHTQNYWQQQNRPQQSHVDSLPQLQAAAGSAHVVYQGQGHHQSHHQPHQGHHQGRRGAAAGNNNHYLNGERKYRGNNHQNRGQKSS